ncbi:MULTISPECIES: NB-ARC domain-containing protein [unclassified Crossiella]|uniref:NB-ARC domain-containing protein n=1 Tax=unclassified Crossiella TaxID=2620835 RepID=UPI001FFEFB62|nr:MULTISPECIES: NB-ARC domain-containing protein [unclassified Crossiella]MCK2242960.1 ATP-binding protein [Crossiella sp. S99.2]MCK2256837.1 ATP-binding protein [Crossiella sp. S99.1]
MADTRNEVNAPVHGNVVQAQRIDQVVLPGRAPEALAGLPAAPEPFTGRAAEVAAVTKVLMLGRTSVAVLAGPPGVGKTAVALRAAHQAMADGGFHGALYVDLRGHDDGDPVTEHAALGAFLRALGISPPDIPAGLTGRRFLYRSRARLLAGPLLVLLDNAASAEQVRGLLLSDSWHRCLITSRQTLATLSGARQFTVAELPTEQSVELLSATLLAARPGDKRATERAALEEIAVACGHLPLALTVAGAILVDDPHRLAQDLADRLSSENRLAQLTFGELDVRLALRHSYQRLPEPEQYLFRVLGLHPGPVIAPEAAAVLCAGTAAETETWLAGLRRAHLITPDGTGFRLPHLLHEFAAELRIAEDAEDVAEAAVARLVRHYRLAAQAADATTRNRGGRASPEQALRWLDEHRLVLTAIVELAHAHELDEDTVALALALRHVLELRGRQDDWVQTHLLARTAAGRSTDRSVAARVAISLGDAYRLGGQAHRAADSYGAAEILRTLLGDTSGADEAVDRLMSLTSQESSRTALAITHFQAAVTAYRDRGEQRQLAHALEHLGRLWGRTHASEALDCHEQALAIFTDLGDRLGQARSRLHQGVLRQQCAEGEAAADCYRAVLDLIESPHRYRALAWFNLGLLALARHRPWRARRCWRAATAELPPGSRALPRIHPVRWWRNQRLTRRLRPQVAEYVAVPVALIAARDLWPTVPADPGEQTLAADLSGTGGEPERPEREQAPVRQPVFDLGGLDSGDDGGGDGGGEGCGGGGCGCAPAGDDYREFN